MARRLSARRCPLSSRGPQTRTSALCCPPPYLMRSLRGMGFDANQGRYGGLAVAFSKQVFACQTHHQFACRIPAAGFSSPRSTDGRPCAPLSNQFAPVKCVVSKPFFTRALTSPWIRGFGSASAKWPKWRARHRPGGASPVGTEFWLEPLPGRSRKARDLWP